MPAVELNLNPDTRSLRQFGIIALFALGAIGGLVLWRGGLFGLDFGALAAPAAYTLWGIAAVSGCLSAIAPRGNRPLWVALILITFPIGFVLSYLLMGLLFYGMLTPFSLAFRLIGRDALKRRFEPSTESYWLRRDREIPIERYFRQF